MDRVRLGRTEISASVMALGAGGPSRLGQSTGRDESESVAVVREALARGVNLIDTAQGYGTEEIVAAAVKDVPRDAVYLSTKQSIGQGAELKSGPDFVQGVHQSLRRLGTDYVDIFHLHGLGADQYDYAEAEILPALVKLKETGAIRFIGITEVGNTDVEHRMLQRALADGVPDVVMVGFNMFNRSARQLVFPAAKRHDVGVMIMFAVRRVFSNPDRLKAILVEQARRGNLPPELATEDALDFFVHGGGAVSVPDTAYRFCRFEPGVDTVLSGTGSLDHLRENIASFERPALPAEDLLRFDRDFAGVDGESGQ